MTVHLDHTIVPSRNKAAGARRLAELLGVPWSPTSLGPFADFMDTNDAFPAYHFCFRVGKQEFDAILERIKAARIAYRSNVHGPVDMKVGEQYGNFYWNEPDGHQWELLTVSYARAPQER